MKKFFTLLVLLFVSVISFAQPPHPGSSSGNSTGRTNKPYGDVNLYETPIATGTSLIAALVAGYAVLKTKKKEDK